VRRGKLIEFGLDLVAAERGQPLQSQVEDRLGLLAGKLGGAGFGNAVPRIVDQRDHGGDVARRPVALHQLFARLVGVLRAADQPDHFVDIRHRYGQAHQDVGAVAGLGEKVLGSPVDHLLAERDETRQQILQVHHQRPAAVERHHVGAERRLQRREAVELVEHNVRHGVAAHFDYDAIAIPV